MSLHLVLGASGQVGGHILGTLRHEGYEAEGTYFQHRQKDLHQLDLRSEADTARLMRHCAPEVVYLPASHTNVDDCERYPEKSFEANVVAVSNVVGAANDVNAKLVYFSSDYIFDGLSGPYAEETKPSPISVYGQHKVMAEDEVARKANNWLTIRTTVVYGWEPQGKNFIYRLIDSLTSGKQIDVPMDQVGTPTYAPDLANKVIELVRANNAGIYNVAGSEIASRYEFAREAAKVFGLTEKLINPVTTKSLTQAAARPLNAGLIITKVSKAVNQTPIGFHEGLRLMASAQREHKCA